jgi:hypothetical protein
MDQVPPKIADNEAQAFAFTVGKTVQNYGTIEYLIKAEGKGSALYFIDFCAQDTPIR